MNIAAIYIKSHEFLIDAPQTINFGTQYFYTFDEKSEEIVIIKKENDNYLEDFFALTKTKSKLTNLTAIVGQNGAGKTSILNIIRKALTSNTNILPSSEYIILFEMKGALKCLNTTFKRVMVKSIDSESTNIVDPFYESKKISSLYYSPHFNYVVHQNFDNNDDHDISMDKIISDDFNIIEKKNFKNSDGSYNLLRELYLRNSLRQIEFLSSSLISEYKIFKDIFNLPEHSEPLLIFRPYKDLNYQHNVPHQFREIINRIKELVKLEISDWVRIRKIGKNNTHSNQVEINQYLLKRYVIECFISIIEDQMDKRGSFLGEGHLESEFSFSTEDTKAIDLFLYLVENCYIKFGKDADSKKLIFSKLSPIIREINSVIESINEIDKIPNHECISIEMETAVKLLKMQNEFINEFDSYYYLFNDKKNTVIEDHLRVGEVINYMPFDKRLSSGENALLDLFSRMYYFIRKNLKEIRGRELKNHYILLLDEPDLAFHPNWKKKFVSSIVKTIPHFFNELDNSPTVEIIFTSHDPLTLSDMPNSNVIYLERANYDQKTKILKFEDETRPKKTFGANISELLADSFFVDNGLIGDFASEKINNTIDWLRDDKSSKDQANYHKKVIELINEPIIRIKLSEMYSEKMNDEFANEQIDIEIRRLEERKKKKEK